MDNWMEELTEHLVFVATLPQEVAEREGVELGTQLADFMSSMLDTYYSCADALNSLTGMLSEKDRTTVWNHYNANLIASRAVIAQNRKEDIAFLEGEE
jgi:hypothetical protein